MKRILVLHNRYRWPGGEDRVVQTECDLLRGEGMDVHLLSADNRVAAGHGPLAALAALWRGGWSKRQYTAVRDAIRHLQPDLAHVHNIWFSFSPAAIAACHDAGLPVVMTLHNFRLLCAGGVLLDTKGAPCQRCLPNHTLPALQRRCYHRSLLATLAVLRMQRQGWRRGVWTEMVDLYLTPSQFCRDRFVEAGLPRDRLRIKPHSAPDPGETGPAGDAPARILYAGRLSREKGLATLLCAWEQLGPAAENAELRLAGDGPLKETLQHGTLPRGVVMTGPLDAEQMSAEFRTARFLALPSECYETFGLVVAEAAAHGRPAVVSRLGGPPELVREGETGLLFPPGDAAALAESLHTLLSHPARCSRMGAAARGLYEDRLTPAHNIRHLLAAYRSALENHRNA